nr:hypothetical protein [uncultured Dyadobacter sp.]
MKAVPRKYTGLLILVLLVAVSWGVFEARYYLSRWDDYRNRPWAYSSDPAAKLLIGEWQGTFTDPARVTKSISVQIFEPTTDAERKAQASKRNRRGGGIRHRDKRSFEGIATVRSKLGTESYEVYGSVGKDNFRHVKCSFRPTDERKRVLPNFTLLQGSDGNWQDDQFALTLAFSYQRKDGSSFYSSADPLYEKKAKLSLQRTLN